MATETEFHQNPRSVAASELLDHGSISFGRFAAESLAWEKWSVFSHNRCQEELEKFKAPGFVAQKKAFFEEYYKRLREMKGLQAKHQEEFGTRNDASLLKEEKEYSCFTAVQTSDDASSANSDASFQGIEKKQEINAIPSSLSSKKETTESVCSTETEELKRTRNSIINQPHEIASSKNVKNVVNKSKTQGSVASSGNINKVRSRSKDSFKSSETMKPSSHDKIAVKADRSVVLGKKGSLKAANGQSTNHVLPHKKTTESIPSSTTRLTSSSRNRLVSSSLSSRSGQIKTESNHRDSINKSLRSVPNNLQSSQCSLPEISSAGSEKKHMDRPKDSSLRARNTLKLENVVEFRPRSCDKERKQDEVKSKSSTVTGRVSKSAIVTPLSSHKSSTLAHKKTTLQPANLAQSRKVEARPKTPSWR